MKLNIADNNNLQVQSVPIKLAFFVFSVIFNNKIRVCFVKCYYTASIYVLCYISNKIRVFV